MTNTNLFEETFHFLETLCQEDKAGGRCRLTPVWVGSKDGIARFTWDQFAEVAKGIEYDRGYGDNQIARDLVVVGGDWWLERWEMDGSEGWRFHSLPVGSPEKTTYTNEEVSMLLLNSRSMHDPMWEGSPDVLEFF
jgi:hypothetical protein